MTACARPFGVSAIATVATIGTALGVVVLLATTSASGEAFPIALALTLFQGLTAYGLWTMRPWAWPVALVVFSIGTLDAVRLLTEGTLNTNLVVGPVVVVYLLQPDVRRRFGW